MSYPDPSVKSLNCWGFDPVKHIFEMLSWMNPARSWHLVLLGVLMFGCSVPQASSALCPEWSPVAISTFTKLWLVIYEKDSKLFFQKQLPHLTAFPFAAQISLFLMLGNSNKIFPQYCVLDCSQPDFIHFISLCGLSQKDHVGNRFFITVSPQTYSHCLVCIGNFIGVFFRVSHFCCFVSAVMACSKVLLLSRWYGRNLGLPYKMIQ